MAISKVTNQNIFSGSISRICKKINPYAASLGSKFEKSSISNFYSKYIDPKGANNTFPVLAGLMLFVGIAPRFIAAANRNPENKEATKDELKEIFFRDAQTVAILLFLLKPLNAVIASIVTKKTGVPMTNKPFEKLFDNSIQGFGKKVQNFMQNPKEKLAIIGRNIKDAINPMGGVSAKTNNEHIADYSHYNLDSLPKLLDKIEAERGDKNEVFNKIIDGTIQKYENIINGGCGKQSFGLQDFLNVGFDKNGSATTNLSKIQAQAQETIKQLKELKQQGVDGLRNVKDKNVKVAISGYLKDENNSLLGQAKGLNGWLRTLALIFETTYLGFGLPALNQLRLEKKYLKNNNNEIAQIFNNDKSSTALINKNIKAHEVKLYHNFIK